MVVEIATGGDWRYTPGETVAWAEVAFASFSPRDDRTRVTVSFNGEVVDRVTTTVPHSYWTQSQQPFCPAIRVGDELVVECEVGPADLRVDLIEHEA